MANLLNLTPHEVVVFDSTGQNVVLRVPPSGKTARVSVKSEVVNHIDGVPVRKTTYGDVVGLPDPEEGVVYIVSTVVLIALKEKGTARNDVVSPDTNPDSVVRDSQGRTVGVRYFQTI